ncbi:hypothetical protein GCM10010420_56630 [Streptomyces glaucosporus]|uniref:Ricin B lectin domain-containing protein n=1 Tax=Streptomyces glaucosporus TaxID=284044 RepID=A0ABN3J1T0_9ACTN
MVGKRRSGRAGAVAAGVLLAVVSLGLPSSAAPRTEQQPERVSLRPADAPGQAATVAGASRQPRARVVGAPWAAASHQLWELRPTAGGHYQLVSVHSGLCLDVSGQADLDGAPAVQDGCRVGDWSDGRTHGQQWRFVRDGDGYRLVARGSGKCLAVPGSGGSTPQLAQYPCDRRGRATWLAVSHPVA